MVIRKKKLNEILERLEKAENTLTDLNQSFKAMNEGVEAVKEKIKELDEAFDNLNDTELPTPQKILMEYFYGKEDKE